MRRREKEEDKIKVTFHHNSEAENQKNQPISFSVPNIERRRRKSLVREQRQQR